MGDISGKQKVLTVVSLLQLAKAKASSVSGLMRGKNAASFFSQHKESSFEHQAIDHRLMFGRTETS